MNSDKKNKVGSGKKSGFSKIEKVHPIKMLLFLSMLGIGVLFLILTIAYVNSEKLSAPGNPLALPKFFSISTVVLLFSSYFISRAPSLYKKDKLKKLKKHLGYTLFLGVLFIGAQFLAWTELLAQGVYFTGKAAGTYIYLISALHVLHLVGGIIFLSYVFYKTTHAAADPVRSLIYIRDPYRQLQFEMVAIYWHFMDILWLGLFFFFLFII